VAAPPASYLAWRPGPHRAAPARPPFRPSGLLLMVAFAEIFPYHFFFLDFERKRGFALFTHTALVRSTSPEREEYFIFSIDVYMVYVYQKNSTLRM
jgi:hypothetical protein